MTNPTKNEMKLGKFPTPAEFPVSYTIGGVKYHGFPEEFAPITSCTRVDSAIDELTVTALINGGIELKAVYRKYLDFPVADVVMYIRNRGTENTQKITDWSVETLFAEESGKAMLNHSTGDTCNEEGYTWSADAINPESPLHIEPCGDGTSCNGAFPYMRLAGDGHFMSVVVGWSGTWCADFASSNGGVAVSVRQARFDTYLKPGETMRSPRLITLESYGDEAHARNLWRNFYLTHICPREYGQPLNPKLVLHTWMIDNLPEFCGTTEQNQFDGIDAYLAGGLHPDIWWIDAGWYFCNNDWPYTGTWAPHPEHFPNGLGPVGKKCEENDIELLVWFEPERVRKGTEIWEEHPDFLLLDHEGAEQALIDYSNPKVVDWVIEKIDALIKDSHIKVYRQDFNIAPAPYWYANDEEGRLGSHENLHTLGYYRFWDTLLIRNPGLWIDSCASGGRRNDIETMKRSVPLHYTDVGYGKHTIKQIQHRQMFEWIPYFRAHTNNWDDANGDYNGSYPIDEFAFQNAFTPSMTCMVEWNDGKDKYDLAHKMLPIWRRVADMELKFDYYPLTECHKDQTEWYAMQFDGENEGFIQFIRNNRAADDSFTVFPFAEEDKLYTFTDELGGREKTVSGAALKSEGFTESIPLRTGSVWFYKKK